MTKHNRILLLLILLGLALRLWFMAANVIDARYSAADDGDYYQRALRLAATGEYVDNSWLIRPPLHVLMFAGLLRIAIALGEPAWGQHMIRAVHLALSLLSILIGYGLARRLFGQRAGYTFAALLALWFPMVELPALILSEPLFFFFLLLHLYLLVRWRDERRPLTLAAAGAALGLAALARSPALYAAAFAVLWLLIDAWERRQTADGRRQMADGAADRRAPIGGQLALVGRRWSLLPGPWSVAALRHILIFTCACVLVIAPWTLRNYLAYGRFIPVDTLGPVNLWLALRPESGEGTGKGILASVPQAERQAFVTREIRETLRNDPMRLFRSAWPHFRHIWKAQFIEDFLVKASFYTRPLRAVWPMGAVGDLIWFVFTLGSLVALAAPLSIRNREPRTENREPAIQHSALSTQHSAHATDGPFRLLVLCWLGYSVLTVMVLHIEPRYLLPVWLLMGLYGAWALSEWRTLLAALRARPFNAALAVALVLGFLYLFFSYRNYPDVLARGLQREQHVAAGERAYAAGDWVRAEAEFRAAVEQHPGFTDGRTDLALALVAQGRYDDALIALDRGDTHRSNVVRGEIARAGGRDELAATYFKDAEFRSGEDIQALTLSWLRPPVTRQLALGNGLDFGYILGFSPGEEANAASGPPTYRWLQGRGRVVLPLPAPLLPSDTLLLHMAGGPGGATPLEVTIGERRYQLAVASGQWRSYRLPIPEQLVGQQRLEIALHAPTFIPAQLDQTSSDTRPLSLMVSEVGVE